MPPPTLLIFAHITYLYRVEYSVQSYIFVHFSSIYLLFYSPSFPCRPFLPFLPLSLHHSCANNPSTTTAVGRDDEAHGEEETPGTRTDDRGARHINHTTRSHSRSRSRPRTGDSRSRSRGEGPIIIQWILMIPRNSNP